MPTTIPGITDWQAAGIDISVQLATAGDLVLGSQQTPFPLNSGGPNGVPFGWTRFADVVPPGNYLFQTANGVFGINNNDPAVKYQAGATSDSYIVPVIGARYQLQVQARIMAGKSASTNRYPIIERFNGSAWVYYVGPNQQAGIAAPTWEQIKVLGAPVPAGTTALRVKLNASPPIGNPEISFGMQYQNVYINKLDGTLPEPTWRDITCDVKALTIRHGRERFTNRYDVGNLQVELNNDKGEYRFQTDHPFGLRPGRQVKVVATYAGVSYPMAYGVLDTITQSYDLDGSVIAVFGVLDVSSILGNTTAASDIQAAPTATERITAIINQAGYPKTLLTDSSNWNMQGINASGRSLRDEAGITADSEGGSFYGERDGTIVYRGRNWPTNDPRLNTVQADLVGQEHSGYGAMVPPDLTPTVAVPPLLCINELQTDWSLDRVINFVTLANQSGGSGTGTASIFTDPVSIKAHGPQSYQRLDFVLWTDQYLPTRAADLMTGNANPILRVNSTTFNPALQKNPSVVWPFVLSVFLNWRVRAWYVQPDNGWGFAVVTQVQSVSHRITPDTWSVSMAVDQPSIYTMLQMAPAWTGWDQGLWDADLWDGGSVLDNPTLWSAFKNWSAPTSIWGN